MEFQPDKRGQIRNQYPAKVDCRTCLLLATNKGPKARPDECRSYEKRDGIEVEAAATKTF